MASLIEWKNQEINKLRRDIDRMFNRFWSYLGGNTLPEACSGLASLEVSETKDSVVVRAEVPGMEPQDLEIWVNGDMLTIRGQKREQSTERGAFYQRVEGRFGSFSRSVRLPCRVRGDKVKAYYSKGALRIVLPKATRSKAVKVRVK